MMKSMFSKDTDLYTIPLKFNNSYNENGGY